MPDRARQWATILLLLAVLSSLFHPDSTFVALCAVPALVLVLITGLALDLILDVVASALERQRERWGVPVVFWRSMGITATMVLLLNVYIVGTFSGRFYYIPSSRDPMIVGEWMNIDSKRLKPWRVRFSADGQGSGIWRSYGSPFEWGTKGGVLHIKYRSNPGYVKSSIRYSVTGAGKNRRILFDGRHWPLPRTLMPNDLKPRTDAETRLVGIRLHQDPSAYTEKDSNLYELVQSLGSIEGAYVESRPLYVLRLRVDDVQSFIEDFERGIDGLTLTRPIEVFEKEPNSDGYRFMWRRSGVLRPSASETAEVRIP